MGCHRADEQVCGRPNALHPDGFALEVRDAADAFSCEQLEAADMSNLIGLSYPHIGARECGGLATFRAACQRWPNTAITLRQLVRCNGHPLAGARISQSRITFVTKPSTSAITMPKPHCR